MTAAADDCQLMGALIPAPEAADLTIKAAQAGMDVAEYIGLHALRSAYGALHPRVVAFERWDKPGGFGHHMDEEGWHGAGHGGRDECR
jgi:hypothetical protein